MKLLYPLSSQNDAKQYFLKNYQNHLKSYFSLSQHLFYRSKRKRISRFNNNAKSEKTWKFRISMTF